MRFLPYNFALILTALLLNGCQNVGNPKPIPRGYIAYGEEFKSAHGPTPRNIGYDYTPEKNSAVMEDLRYPAADLVAKLDRNLSFSDDKIYLIRPHNSAFYSSLDHLLRDELVKSGYVVSPTPAGAVPVSIIGQETEEQMKDSSQKQPKKAYRKLYLALAVMAADGKTSRHVDGVYEVPAYDFTPTEKLVTEAPPKSKKNYPASLQRIE
jgi:hypothetical protein